MDLGGFFRAARAMGATGVDIVAGHFPRGGVAALRAATDRAREMGLEVVALGMAGDLTLGAPAARRATISSIGRWLWLAHTVGARIIRVFAGASSARDAVENRTGSILRAVAPLARKLEVAVAVENHGGVTNPDALYRALRRLPRPWVGACLDLGNFAPEDRATGYGVRKLAPVAVHVHVKDLGKDNAREGLDVAGGVGIIRKSGYRGWYCLEYEGPDGEAKAVPAAFSRMARAARGGR